MLFSVRKMSNRYQLIKTGTPTIRWDLLLIELPLDVQPEGTLVALVGSREVLHIYAVAKSLLFLKR